MALETLNSAPDGTELGDELLADLQNVPELLSFIGDNLKLLGVKSEEDRELMMLEYEEVQEKMDAVVNVICDNNGVLTEQQIVTMVTELCIVAEKLVAILGVIRGTDTTDGLMQQSVAKPALENLTGVLEQIKSALNTLDPDVKLGNGKRVELNGQVARNGSLITVIKKQTEEARPRVRNALTGTVGNFGSGAGINIA